MKEHEVAQHFEEYVLGLLAPERVAEVDAHLQTCAACRKDVRELEQAMMAFSAQPNSVEKVRARLDASLSGGARFDHLIDDAAELFDLKPDEVRALFASIDDPGVYSEGPADGVKIIPVTPGPRAKDSFSAIVRVDAGATFPMHEHFGEERVLVLEGGYRSSGAEGEFWRGDLDVRQAGTSHSFTALDDLPCICASVAWPPKE